MYHAHLCSWRQFKEVKTNSIWHCTWYLKDSKDLSCSVLLSRCLKIPLEKLKQSIWSQFEEQAVSEELIWHLKQEVDWLVFSGGFRQQIQPNSQPSGLKNLPSHMALSSPGIKRLCCCDKSVMHYRMEKAFMLWPLFSWSLQKVSDGRLQRCTDVVYNTSSFLVLLIALRRVKREIILEHKQNQER